MKTKDILNLDGIIIRKIPKTTVSLFGYYPDKHKTIKGEIVTIDGRQYIKEVKENSLAGYCITFDNGQGSMVQFIKTQCGFGETIEEAYVDYINKN